MRIISIPILFLLFSIPVFCQERIWIEQSKIAKVKDFEKEINPLTKPSTRNEHLSKDYYPLADKYKVTLPIVYQRDSVNYFTLNAGYFYTPENSVLRLVSYDWEKDRYGNFFEKQKIWKEESKKFPIYNSEFERIKKILISQLGKPSSADTIAKGVNDNGNKYFTRSALWETDSIYGNLFMIFESHTYRKRFTLYWKQ